MDSKFEHVSGYNQTVSISEAAKLIGFPGGEHLFFDWLRKKGLLQLNNFPSQKMRDRDYFIVFNHIEESDFDPTLVYVTRIKIKGVAYLSKLVAKEFPLCPPCAESLKNNNI